ncbi:hypothetical protein L7F22_039357 [Adiantum nelumboides]|nr:hypothetical protein [Adiantum nelumboides]
MTRNFISQGLIFLAITFLVSQQVTIAYPLESLDSIVARSDFSIDSQSSSPFFTRSTKRSLSSSVKSCLSKTGAKLSYPSNSNYTDLSKAENTNYGSLHPDVIVSPSSTQQVAATVKCVAADNGNTKFSPRGGGHGYAAYSLSVTTGAGATLGPLAKTIGQQGFALPHGTCPQVGSAHGLGGGWGFASRHWGWLMDHIVALELVDAKGNIKTLNQQSTGSDADLWWALRGAGSNNFGVVTHFTYAMEQAPALTTNYNHVYGSNADCAKVLLVLQDLGSKTDANSGLPSEFGAELLMYGENSGDDGACSLSGQYLGSKTNYQSTMKKINSALSAQGVTATKVSAQEFNNWVDALTNIMGDLDQGKVYESYYAQSIMDDGKPGYTASSAKAITDAMQAAVGVEGSGNSISFDLNGPLSATNANPAYGDMSFNHRNSLFFSQIYSYDFPGFDNQNARSNALQKISAITQATRNAKPNGDWHAYQNYIDPELKNFGTAYYGNNLDRLKSIKTSSDPKTIFDFPQGLAHA